MATRLSKRIRAAELDGLPHEWDTVYELLGGVLHMSRRPSVRHQRVLSRLFLRLGPAVVEQGGEVLVEPGVVWEDDGDDNVAPDLAVFLSPPPDDDKVRVCPDIVVEILSPGDESRRRDLESKRDLYWRRGASEYWVLDPDEGRVVRLVRQAQQWDEHVLAGDALLATPLLPDWSGLRTADLFR